MALESQALSSHAASNANYLADPGSLELIPIGKKKNNWPRLDGLMPAELCIITGPNQCPGVFSVRPPRKSDQTAASPRDSSSSSPKRSPDLGHLGQVLSGQGPATLLRLPTTNATLSSPPPCLGRAAASVSSSAASGAGGGSGALELRPGQGEGYALMRATWLVPPTPNPLRRRTARKLQGAQRPLAGSVVEYTTITDYTTYSTTTTTTTAAATAATTATRRRQRAGHTERNAARRSPTTREHHGAPPVQQEVPPPRRLGRTPPLPAPEPEAPPPPPPQSPQPPGPVEAPPPATVAATVADVVTAAVLATSAASAALARDPAATHPAGSPEAALVFPWGQEAAVARLSAPTFGVAILWDAPAEGLASPPRLLLLLSPAVPSAGAVRAAEGQEGLPDAAPPLSAPQQTALAIPSAPAQAPSGSFGGHGSSEALAHAQHQAPAQLGPDFGPQEDQEIQKNHRTFRKFHQLHKKSIIFIRDRNAHGQELSGYIDYAHRLKMEDFEVYFTGKRKLLPRPTDLSFYNWDSHVAILNSSPNYQVIAENCDGLLFKYKRDRKIINVDPKVHPGDNSTRTPIQTDLYLQVVIYDHVSRRKT